MYKMQLVCYVQQTGSAVNNINVCFHAALDLINTAARFCNNSQYIPLCSCPYHHIFHVHINQKQRCCKLGR